MPSFLIDTVIDEVSQTGTWVLLNLGPVLLNYGPVIVPIQANTMAKQCQNSVKTVPTVPYRPPPFQQRDELHQKDLRINLDFLHILGPGYEGYLQADMFLALSLIVEN